MTIALPAVTTFPRRLAWTADPRGSHTASLRGEFAGRILENPDGSFVGFDGRSTPVGRYETLREAKRAVGDIARGVATTRAERMNRIARPVASATGVISVALLIAAGAEAVLPVV
ncbi:hypothetical protein [Microbacterium thalassium]|uniref:Peptide ABC transporter permease n=1 Tax=Microbacterium thalassium TaxID=362649 RepID=A0A7X0KU77_9MICO|nr:hypothetical protein [Microbacterium thalassium]MBB6390844.1 hypothetical protein [Microbacterium thalassium]GLK25952.1 hypothetical protein GCM10017607_32710 [Microbacterium thalassium]